MRLRIVSAYSKVAYCFAASAFSAIVPGVAFAVWGSWAGHLMAASVLVLVIGCAARTFRDAEIEPIHEPRAWWRMTARPTSGFVVGTIFIGQGLWVALTEFSSPDGWALVVRAATHVYLGVMFLRSSFTLRAEGAPAPVAADG